jgi:NAD(P)-dependent dehydrogenase (short-subunit alcohol dehydrogenase family)
MVSNGSGVIMTVTSLLSRTGTPSVGGYGPAQAAKEALTRDLSAELAPQGIRVVGLRPQGMPETRTIKDAFEPRAKASGMTLEQWQKLLASRTPPATSYDARGDGKHGGLHGFRQGERDDGNDRQT